MDFTFTKPLCDENMAEYPSFDNSLGMNCPFSGFVPFTRLNKLNSTSKVVILLWSWEERSFRRV
uniref:Uncharacterized protein n=1 Tax=Lepeophtheirus salmonis TaxID=72036 RepID=A0A0K2VJA3_LEPSM